MSQRQLQVSNRYDPLACPVEATHALIHSLDDSGEFPIASGELSIAFVTDAAIAKVHEIFMDDPTATDVITFPGNAGMDFAGEIIVSVDHAIKQAKAFDEPFSRELSLYLIHGWLHLAGYDDRSQADQNQMRQAEQRALTIAARSSADKRFNLSK